MRLVEFGYSFLEPISFVLTDCFVQQRRLGDVSIPSYLEKDDDDKDRAPEFCLDAGVSGNVARFINHSCQPNLFVQCVLSIHHDINLARVVLFAADNIPPLKVYSLLSVYIYIFVHFFSITFYDEPLPSAMLNTCTVLNMK